MTRTPNRPQSDPPPTERTDGFVPIADYGVLGDGRGIALVASDGTIDWWAAPQLDSPPPIAALLDPAEGGRIELRPADDGWTTHRRYLPNTNVLETTFSTPTGSVRITDSLNSGNAGALPWSELARRVEGLSGTVPMLFALTPGTGLAQWSPWLEQTDRGIIAHTGSLTIGVITSADITMTCNSGTADTAFTIAAGERRMLALVAADDAPLYLPDADSVDQRLDLSTASWAHWADQVRWEGDRRDQVVRSLLALKLLMMARTGAIAAAATTSLPERIGGDKNWDYRFSWVRDTALTIGAMSAGGLQEEVHAAIVWLLHTIRDHGPDVHVMYRLDGSDPGCSEIAPVPGYRGSTPVQVGNDASSQMQTGVYGDLMAVVAAWVFDGHVLDVGTARQLADLADRCADLWRLDDAGIWELEQTRPYTSTKMNCWRALDRAAKLAAAGHIPGSAARWRAEADRIKEWVDRHCWSELKQAYTFYAGSEQLDASVLMGASWGFEQSTRMSSTIDALVDELGVGPLLYRYSGMQRQEQAFIACSYWLVQALVVVGRRDEAQSLMDEMDGIAGPLGLLSEMSTPGTGELLGNFPQALSHLTLINAATMLRDGPTQ